MLRAYVRLCLPSPRTLSGLGGVGAATLFDWGDARAQIDPSKLRGGVPGLDIAAAGAGAGSTSLRPPLKITAATNPIFKATVGVRVFAEREAIPKLIHRTCGPLAL